MNELTVQVQLSFDSSANKSYATISTIVGATSSMGNMIISSASILHSSFINPNEEPWRTLTTIYTASTQL
ncbi:uncharacterized protein N7503_001882 [Penicillium pulvis]|uniref:uncharacterized protein n=1 Tax=Penicillium pulvis TaxID=1562058 RepID=UPI00254883C7|nr:uncharacterized protein N7503_001882 [Penicillium pulvis]KAJ5809664.1 hypothetical protein N7503_001882 [Penicillium pulvis]